MISPTKAIHQAAWMQRVPREIWYFKCKVCEIRFSMRTKTVEQCPYCKYKDVVRIPLCAFKGRRSGNGK